MCLNQWERFRENPIVYAMELTWGKSDFPYAGITICSNYYDEEAFTRLIQENWQVKPNDTKYQYYWQFLSVLNSLHVDNLKSLTPFAKDKSLKKLKLLDVLLQLHAKRFPTQLNDSVTLSSSLLIDLDNRFNLYAPAITEGGLCKTTSQLSKYTNPFGKLVSLSVSKVIYCGFLNECNTKILPLVDSKTDIRIYIHNVFDVVMPGDRNTILHEIKADGSLTMELLLSATTAESGVRNLPIQYRKCRYPDENVLKYFEIYRPGVCRSECRIDAALRLCKCKPYFYAVAPEAPICDVDGMLCLDRKNWTQTPCNCVPLCEEINYINLRSTIQKAKTSKFESTIIVMLNLPSMAIKRRVVFSTDQLVVSFGGAINLFLGASFISVFNVVYIFVDARKLEPLGF
ncbi:acid-sensing ion channel 4-A [Teleopsis dalmanni]|uniref:acid-sensing ion channel 4-A n=1 Tax=Teleopsis dalmanni TaxID=139649 RepID=UPI0018CE840E|nr:acid-sensing ion channel 4-A [Teleopsis dalmanni]